MDNIKKKQLPTSTIENNQPISKPTSYDDLSFHDVYAETDFLILKGDPHLIRLAKVRRFRNYAHNSVKYIRTNDEILSIRRWWAREGVPWYDVMEWRESYPDFKKIYEEGKYLLGDWNQEGAKLKVLDRASVELELGNYDPGSNGGKPYKELLEEREKRKKDGEEKPTTVNVHYNPVTTTKNNE